MGSRLLQIRTNQDWEQALHNPPSNGARAVLVLTAAGYTQAKIATYIDQSVAALARFSTSIASLAKCELGVVLVRIFEKSSPTALNLIRTAQEADVMSKNLQTGLFFEQLLMAMQALDNTAKAQLKQALLAGYASHPQLLNKRVSALPMSLVRLNPSYPSLLATAAACGILLASEVQTVSMARIRHTITLGDVKVTVDMPIGGTVIGQLNGYPVQLPPQ